MDSFGKMISLDKNYSTTRLVGSIPQRVETNPVDKLEAPSLFAKCECRNSDGGLRTMGYSKQSYKFQDSEWLACDSGGTPINPITLNAAKLNMQMDGTDLPLITIVTVVYNGEKFIEKTIQSVINQNYPNVEYIVVDGGSTDGTLDIIRKYEHAIDYWVSEKDNGIYDAMNKGIDLATGKWINFMNAGDYFSGSDVLNKVFKNAQYSNAKIIYGDHIVNYGKFSIERKAGDIKSLWRGSQFCHQSVFINSSFHRLRKYNTIYKIAADFDFFYSSYVDDAHFVKVSELISIITSGGVSDIQRIKSITSWMRTVCRYNHGIKYFFYYGALITINVAKMILKKVMPKKIILMYIAKKSR